MITVAIGADHRGFDLKQSLQKLKDVCDTPVTWLDVGADSEDRSDYPVFAIKAVEAMKAGKAQFAVLTCGTGVGMAVAANRYSDIYAALAWNTEVARLAREDDNANILVLPSDYVTFEQAHDMVCAWLSARFKSGRYQQRIDLIDAITQ